MKLGIVFSPTDLAIRPDMLAAEVESRGFESLWFPDHSHTPTSRLTPWGGRPGAPPLPEHYSRTHDQFVALAFAAAATSRLRLGTGITLVAQRDPIWTAKQVASLDFLSGGRLVFGVGYGWNREEMSQHGIDFKERRALLREKVLLMKALWTQDEASYQGDLLSLEPSWAWPKPVQQPHPPIFMGGGAGPTAVAHMVEFCDGWMPMITRHEIKPGIDRVRRALAEAGRDESAFEITVSAAKPEAIPALEAMGVDRTVLTLPPLPPETAIERLDLLAQQVGLA